MNNKLEGNGLRPGVYHIKYDRLISEGASIHGGKEQIMQFELHKSTTWEEILKLLPKGSIIKSTDRVR